MEKILNTDSKFCKILIKGDHKYVIKYPRKLHSTIEYYRSTREDEVLHLLMENNFLAPKLFLSKKDYHIQEYINGELISNIYKDHEHIDHKIIDEIILQILKLTKINSNSLMKYTKWSNNEDFYLFQVKNTEKVFSKYYEDLGELYNKLSISPEIFKYICPHKSEINNNRKMSLMHGDRHKKNMILKDGNLIFIDWDLSCVGDIAYDIAFHLHQTAYTQQDELYFFTKLKEYYSHIGSFNLLKNDIDFYRKFCLFRSTLYHVYWTDLVYKDGNKEKIIKQLNHFKRRYNKLCNYPEFNLSPKDESELDDIFSEYRKKSGGKSKL